MGRLVPPTPQPGVSPSNNNGEFTMNKVQCECGANSFERAGNGLVRCAYCRTVYYTNEGVVKTGETVVASFDNLYDWETVEETYQYAKEIKAEDTRAAANLEKTQAMLAKREEQGKWFGYGCLFLVPLLIMAVIETFLLGFPMVSLCIFIIGGVVARKKIKQYS